MYEILREQDEQQELPKEVRELHAEERRLEREIQSRNLGEAAKVMTFLTEFYQDRNVAYDRRLTLSIAPDGETRLESQGAQLQAIASPEMKQAKLAEYQGEMTAFTDFLKEKYYSS